MKLFIKEHLWGISLIFINSILLVFIGLIDDISDSSILAYYIFLSYIFLIIFLIYRYYKNKKLYALLKNNKEEDYIGDTALCKSFQKYIQTKNNKQFSTINEYRQHHENYQSFINRWVHALKTPLSVLNLIYQSNENNEIIKEIQSETDKILEGLNLALGFSRTSNIKQDFFVEQINVKDEINTVLNELKRLFIRKLVFPRLIENENNIIYSDKKWFKFIITQILSNSIKYSNKQNSVITITISKNDILIKDNGIGIASKDIHRIFDLFYTGGNGRLYGESTGIGLYLVKKISDELNFKLNIRSKLEKGTEFIIKTNSIP